MSFLAELNYSDLIGLYNWSKLKFFAELGRGFDMGGQEFLSNLDLVIN